MTDGRTIACPTCGKPSGAPPANATFPFCSSTCRMVDLGRWMQGEYALDPASGKLDVIDPDEAEEVDLGED